jgi:hypothetical protein
MTRDGTLESSDILTDAQQAEFQLRYKYAHN